MTSYSRDECEAELMRNGSTRSSYGWRLLSH